ncbi:MAG: TraK family protein, partial [Desulfovibrio sp.]|nr:TraK family protein [Desulfovibrio sp.]
LACRELIESLLSQGFDKRKIHTRLMESGQVTMSYDAFCKVLLKASRNKLSIQSLSPPPVSVPAVAHKMPAPAASPGSKIIKPISDTLQDPRTIDASKLF